jgi:hypothetical protein
MEELTSTIRIKRKTKEDKSIPVVCSWCNKLFKITKWEIENEKKIRITHGICPDCSKEMKEKIELAKRK